MMRGSTTVGGGGVATAGSSAASQQQLFYTTAGMAGVDGAAKKALHFKLVLLGDTSVGKSCIVVRFAKDEFYEYQESTIGAAFMTQSVDVGSCIVKFEIWDTAGQERYRSLAPMYYRGAAAAVVVYDITNRDSFQGAKSWIQELQVVNDRSSIVIALAGNKEDLANERQVPTAEAQQYAEEQGVLFIETSAKTGHNVSELFYEIGSTPCGTVSTPVTAVASPLAEWCYQTEGEAHIRQQRSLTYALPHFQKREGSTIRTQVFS